MSNKYFLLLNSAENFLALSKKEDMKGCFCSGKYVCRKCFEQEEMKDFPKKEKKQEEGKERYIPRPPKNWS